MGKSIQKLFLLSMIMVLAFNVCAANEGIKELGRMQERVKIAKEEMALLDYDIIYEKLNEASKLAASEEDQDKIKAFQILKEVDALATESRPVETRAVWLDDIALTKIVSPDDLRELIRSLAELNVNMLLPSVYFGGETIYKSEIVPQMDWFKINFGDEDPFQIMLDEAKKYGMEVHPWVMVYGLQGNIEPYLDKIEWFDKAKDGSFNNTVHVDYFLSPAHPEVSDHLMSIIQEVTDYDVDGIHLDNIRYKDGFGYGDYARELYQELFGIDPCDIAPSNTRRYNHFREFKAQFIASFVERVRYEMHEKDPHIMVSAATAPGLWGKNSLGQDWHNWVDNRSLHFVLSMSYIETVPEYDDLIRQDINRVGSKTYIYPGMALYAFSPTVMQGQWQIGQRAPTTGQTLFSLLHIKDTHYQLLKNGLFRQKAYPTFRDPQKAAILYIDWLKERIETLGIEAGLSEEEKKEWLETLSTFASDIKEAPSRPYDTRDLREEDQTEQAYWENFLAKLDAFILKTRKGDIKDPLKARLMDDLLGLKSLITPLEYTSRTFETVPIKY